MRKALAMIACLLVSASTPDPADWFRQANEAYERGDIEAAETLYERALQRGPDPGVIAFNQGVLAMQREQYAVAELAFRRALDDAAAPLERRARAWYNLGNCWLKRANPPTIAYVRTAMQCYRNCLDLAPPEPLAGDARHNLELAKWLRNTLSEQEPQNDSPNQDPPETRNLPNPQPPKAGGDNSSDAGDSPDSKQSPQRANGAPMPNRTPTPIDVPPTPGAGKLPVLLDTDSLQPLAPDQSAEWLQNTADRLLRERRNRSRIATPGERPDVRNW